MTTFNFPICVAEDGTVTHPDKLDFDPYLLPWVTGAEDTLPARTRAAYPAGRADLREKLSVLKSKRAQNGAEPRHTAWAIGGTLPTTEDYDDPTARRVRSTRP